MLRNLDKHKKYKDLYKPNDFYWGLGVEHETYIKTSKLKQITLKELKENRAAERYSVSYYNVYTKQLLDEALDGLFESNTPILIPILLNSHSFIKTDINGEHQTTYERIPKPNPKFNGKTMFEWMKEYNPDIFANEYEKSYIFDGDTIEFITQNFYKAKLNDVLSELEQIQENFINALNSLPKEGLLQTYGPFILPKKNYPFASYITNLKNNAMFNNGTIHVNITLPTKLDENCEIQDLNLFVDQHRNLARAFQWLSPLLIANYGSPDPLCESKNNSEKYSAGSQRISVSRYIGLGTYDTDIMEVGKILTKKRDELKDIDWYNSFHEIVDYKFLNELGMDINFNKHYSHGLEFRIFDSIPLNDLEEILKITIYLADFSLDKKIDNPKKYELWQRIAKECVHNGKGYFMNVSDQNDLFNVFNVPYLSKEPLNVVEVLEIIKNHLFISYENGLCVRYMIRGEHIYKEDIEEKPQIKEEIKNNKENIVEINIKKDEIQAAIKVPEVTINKKLWCC